MLDFYKVISVSHKNLKTEDLSHFVLKHESESQLAFFFKKMMAKFRQEEAVYLNTCNRVLVFFYGHHLLTVDEAVQLFRQINPDLDPDHAKGLSKAIEMFDGIDAIRHLFEVASSLDSLVVGEREIFRQVRQAFSRCKALGLSGDHMRLAEKSIVKAAKEVYTETEIGRKPVSVVSLVMQQVLQAGLVKSAKILLLGTGETNVAVGRSLKKQGYHDVVLFNRTLENALGLAEELNAEAKHLADLKGYDQDFDCIIACTSAQRPIVDLNTYQNFIHPEKQRIVVDLAVPRNISKDVEQLDQVRYIAIESIREAAEENMKFRSGNVASAKVIINRHLEDFIGLYDRRRVERAFKGLSEEIGRIRDRALNKVYKAKIDEVDDDARQLIEEIVSYMEKKCVAVPMKMARTVIQEETK